jgi:hypothetical protein
MNGTDRSSADPWRFPAGTLGSAGSRGDNAQGESTDGTPSSPPAISLPKGGGAIRAMGEKFAANPVTGTGSLSVPIYTSPGRSGFGSELSLAYDSGTGNGSFGFGWSLFIPSITRKTDKGLPQYLDDESDVQVPVRDLLGVEDDEHDLRVSGSAAAHLLSVLR